MAKNNISTNEVGKNAPIFLVAGSPELVDIDPLFVRVVGSDKSNVYGGYGTFGAGLGGTSGGTGIVPPVVAGEGTDPKVKFPEYPDASKPLFPEFTFKIGYPAPDLSDIEIYKQEIDYTVTPPTVSITFRVRNSTAYPVVGLNAKVPKQ
jgi:hypothetical protein